MCRVKSSGKVAVFDCAACPYEFGSPVCISDLLHTLSLFAEKPERLVFEEELVFHLDPEKTRILTEYTDLIKKVRKDLLEASLFGHQYDDFREDRRNLLRRIYYELFRSPLNVLKLASEYSESGHRRKLFLDAYQKFKTYLDSLVSALSGMRLVSLFREKGDFRDAFFSLVGIKSLPYIDLFVLELPPGLKEVASYTLPYEFQVKIYEYPQRESFLYVLNNRVLDGLSQELLNLLKRKIIDATKEVYKASPSLFDTKFREFTQWFMDEAIERGIKLSSEEAVVLGREVAVWSVGMGGPIENLALDRENITDIYIDSENSPVYLEHREYGLCHTLMRYNRDLLERAFLNAVLLSAEDIKFDERNPVFDSVIERLNARVHLQRPPATFGELQAAIRVMKPSPFTYPEYLYYRSMSPFFAGYDDVMVSLGCSEAVLGLKSSGKTSFTAAKIASIGTARRILPIQDIEEIPIKLYRKLGFHIGASRVSGGITVGGEGALDLVRMANALLRMGDAAIIINEIRSREAIQGVINLLNTQPGVFLLYNLHAESLEDVRDRLELVFGIPAASMFATDRYSILKKVKFGRRGRLYRVLGEAFETNRREKTFERVFEFKMGTDIDSSVLRCFFLKNPEASSQHLRKIDFGRLEKELDVEFIPPALAERSRTTGVPPEQYLLQAFFKAKIFYDLYELAVRLGRRSLLGIEFFLKVNATANKLLASAEREGRVDYGMLWKEWLSVYRSLVKAELRGASS